MNHSIDNQNEVVTCIKCPKVRFPKPNEQCYKFGGLICEIDCANVGKYDKCRFDYTVEILREI